MHAGSNESSRTELIFAYQGALIGLQLSYFKLLYLSFLTVRNKRTGWCATVGVRMKTYSSPLHFLVRILSKPDPKLRTNGMALKDSSRSPHVLLVGVRSPGDQLHVVAIKSFEPNEEYRIRPPYSSS
jgi:hypothetical protein